jgi:hypothetical protein
MTTTGVRIHHFSRGSWHDLTYPYRIKKAIRVCNSGHHFGVNWCKGWNHITDSSPESWLQSGVCSRHEWWPQLWRISDCTYRISRTSRTWKQSLESPIVGSPNTCTVVSGHIIPAKVLIKPSAANFSRTLPKIVSLCQLLSISSLQYSMMTSYIP